MTETNKVALITAASKGMGAACARELAARGWKVALFARSEAVNTLAEELGGIAMQGDLLNAADLERFVKMAHGHYGRIDGVVNSTGHPPKGDLLTLPDRDWHTGLDMMILNVVRIAREVTPMMQEQGQGAFVNISTFGAVEPSLAFPISSAVRAALGAFTKLFADRYAADNIRMNSILPGFIDSYAADAATVQRIPAGRVGTVEEIGKTAAFLLSDDAGYITGQNIVVDGGLTHGY